MWLVGIVVRRYIDFLVTLLIPTRLVLALFCSSIPTSLFVLECFFVLKSRSCEHGDIIISTRTYIDCTRVSPETSTCKVPSDVSRKLQLTLCAIMAS